MGNGINKILPNLYLGNFRDAKDREQLTKFQIKHIVSLYDNAAPVLDDMNYKCVKVADNPQQDLAQHFWECIEFIHQARIKEESVLVHCIAGVSRSTTIICAYMMVTADLSWNDAVNVARCCRSVANPNSGFLKQLQDFQEGKVSEFREKLLQTYEISKVDKEHADSILRENHNQLRLSPNDVHFDAFGKPKQK